ncbi:MAG TPA: tetratricopeptide repeat protein [Bryobacteraceae bacterium]|nr:tetratricopeptide repeat protein [Bryobacteraceae bacterium]
MGRKLGNAVSILMFTGLGALAWAADKDHGVDLYRQGKFADAQAELTKVMDQSPDDAQVHRYLGLALVEMHKPSDAEPHLNRANDLDPSDDSKLALARLYVEEKQYDKAQALLDSADGPSKDYVTGLLLFGRQKNADAAAAFESYLQKNPNDAYAHYYAGLAYNGAKRPDKMLTQFELFLKLRPDAPEAKKVRAVLTTGH